MPRARNAQVKGSGGACLLDWLHKTDGRTGQAAPGGAADGYVAANPIIAL